VLSVANEAAIRDELAKRLELIEPGLTLVKTNFPLPNAHGTRGFLDILARDTTGMLVVIEIKRSDSTAREAIHEVLKYVELLRRERGMANDRLRAIIVSTTWRELLVPFSVARAYRPCRCQVFVLGLT
jgi:RecB family endonuclease NucS